MVLAINSLRASAISMKWCFSCGDKSFHRTFHPQTRTCRSGYLLGWAVASRSNAESKQFRWMHCPPFLKYVARTVAMSFAYVCLLVTDMGRIMSMMCPSGDSARSSLRFESISASGPSFPQPAVATLLRERPSPRCHPLGPCSRPTPSRAAASRRPARTAFGCRRGLSTRGCHPARARLPAPAPRPAPWRPTLSARRWRDSLSSVFFSRMFSSSSRAIRLRTVVCPACIPKNICPRKSFCCFGAWGKTIPTNFLNCSRNLYAAVLPFMSASFPWFLPPRIIRVSPKGSHFIFRNVHILPQAPNGAEFLPTWCTASI